MPVMGGIEATEKIRHEFDKSRQPSIIALTADALAENKEKCLAAGMNQVLTKPVTKNDLASALLCCQRNPL